MNYHYYVFAHRTIFEDVIRVNKLKEIHKKTEAGTSESVYLQ